MIECFEFLRFKEKSDFTNRTSLTLNTNNPSYNLSPPYLF